MKTFILVILLFSTTSSFAQKEDYNWIFNWSDADELSIDSEWNGSVLNFNTMPPNFYKDVNIDLDFGKTNTIISDSLGQILMYSNGQAIHEKIHRPIQYGDTINYSLAWEGLSFPNETGENKPVGFRILDLATIIPWPLKSNKWFALYQNYQGALDDGYYELWSTSINQEDNLIADAKDSVIYNKITRGGFVRACQHANGQDWWVMQWQVDTLHYFLLNESGIHLDHNQIIPGISGNLFGQSSFSHDGNKFAYFGAKENPSIGEIFYAKFDRCNGSLYNIQQLEYEGTLTALNNGIAFSPNGRYLYISELEKIMQYDTSEEDFLNNPIVVGEWDGVLCDFESGGTGNKFGAMQRGPDGKIYISGSNQCFYIHTIDNPDEKGLDCNFNQRAIRLESFHVGTVPNFNTYRLGPIDGSSCDTLGIDNNPVAKFWYEQDTTEHHEIQFRDISYYRPEVWTWTFGDVNTSDEVSPLHEYTENGVYEVCLTVSNENSSNTSCQELQIGPVANQNVVREYDINIFPNPVEDITRLVFHDYLPEKALINLYNTSGQRILTTRVYQETLLDLSVLDPGAYLYEIIDGHALIASGKIVKI